ncbi:unnamed protein product [Chrysoparadoxa australica]
MRSLLLDYHTQGGIGVDELRRAHQASIQLSQHKVAAWRDMMRQAALTIQKAKSLTDDITIKKEEKVKAQQQKCERDLIHLLAEYAAVMREELVSIESQVNDRNVKVLHALDHIRISRRLAIFTLHLKHETYQAVKLLKLPDNHPQYLRCQKAATENIRAGFFDGTCFHGLKVLDVYKIENKLQLERFQQDCDAAGPGAAGAGAVKGLFCAVPQQCLEHLVLHGLRQGSSTAERHVQRHPALSLDGQSFLDKFTRHGQPMPHPRWFSRYSTLLSERAYIVTQHQANEAASEGAGGGVGAAGADKAPGKYTRIRCLALCRVRVGKIYMASDGDGLSFSSSDCNPSESLGGGTIKGERFDSIYSAAHETYEVLNEESVLPEFVLLCRYRHCSARKIRDESHIRQVEERMGVSNLSLGDKFEESDGDEGDDEDARYAEERARCQGLKQGIQLKMEQALRDALCR